MDYMAAKYFLQPEERLFPYTKSYLSHEMIRGCKITGVKRIRIHDIRHSHASLLINQGYDALVIADRLGHEKVSTTLNTYSHLFPHKQQALVDNLEALGSPNNPTSPTPSGYGSTALTDKKEKTSSDKVIPIPVRKIV